MLKALGKLRNSNINFAICISVVVLFGSCASNPQHKFVMANLYYQKAPEVRALYYQGYNAAIDFLKKNARKKKRTDRCIVMDVDETILDNSPYQGWLFENKDTYSSKTWEAWVAKEAAEAVPGSLEFYQFARKHGYKIYLVTNRKAHLKDATLNNLRKAGFNVEAKDMIGRTNTSSKVERRNNMTKNCEVVLLAGDSLADFHEKFEGSVEEREKALHDFKDDWGRKFIVFPNPMYGDWTRKEASRPLDSFEMD